MSFCLQHCFVRFAPQPPECNLVLRVGHCTVCVIPKQLRFCLSFNCSNMFFLQPFLIFITLSMRTTFSDRISLNAFQNGGKPSLWYNFCLGITISQLLFGIWQRVIIVSIWLKNAGIYLSFFNIVSYWKYLTLNESDDLRKVISWAT